MRNNKPLRPLVVIWVAQNTASPLLLSPAGCFTFELKCIDDRAQLPGLDGPQRVGIRHAAPANAYCPEPIARLSTAKKCCSLSQHRFPLSSERGTSRSRGLHAGIETRIHVPP
jgi:hypothetical protein